jgi:hypothetical protein
MLPVRAVIVGVLLSSMVGVTSAAAQAPTHDWSEGSSVNLFGGLSMDGDAGGGLFGGGAGWALTPLFGLEGRVGWSKGVSETDAFAASLTGRFSPRKPRTSVPFARVGVGLYRASFDTTADIPEFYRRRLTAGDLEVNHRRSMIDPSILVGAGVDVWVSRHVAIRPEVEVTTVLSDGRGYLVTNATFHIIYTFESRPVTPSTR